MSRLFVSPRELNFFSDLAKEVTKDVIGSFVYYYPINELKTRAHPVYNESIAKVFDSPIKLDCIVDSQVQVETKIGKFGIDQNYKLEVFIHYRDLVEKNINVCVGDFFSFSDIFYEITESNVMNNIYGLPEHKCGIKVIGTKAREGQFSASVIGPTDIARTDDDAVMKTFEQQRGRASNSFGPTGDVRDLVKAGALEQSITGPKQVSELGGSEDNSTHRPAFYDEDV